MSELASLASPALPEQAAALVLPEPAQNFEGGVFCLHKAGPEFEHGTPNGNGAAPPTPGDVVRSLAERAFWIRKTSNVSVNVRWFRTESSPSGRFDFSAAFSVLRRSGGTLYVPPGEYTIDAVKSPVEPSDNTTLQLSPGARLVAAANESAAYSIVRIANRSNVVIDGGEIIGERDHHQGSVGEWGMGISVLGSTNISIRRTTIKDCWGDGIYIGRDPSTGRNSSGLRVEGASVTNNRRNAVSVISCEGCRFEASIFSGTHGTPPESGIDVEPDGPEDLVYGVQVLRSKIEGNRGHGIGILPLAYDAPRIDEIEVLENTIVANGRHGVFASGSPMSITIARNELSRNEGIGIGLQVAKGVTVADNIVSGGKNRGIYLDRCTGVDVLRNRLVANSFYGVDLDRSSNNNIRDNEFVDNDRTGGHTRQLKVDSIGTGNKLTNNKADLTALPVDRAAAPGR